jgi:hypothetical protein
MFKCVQSKIKKKIIKVKVAQRGSFVVLYLKKNMFLKFALTKLRETKKGFHIVTHDLFSTILIG